MNNMNMSGSTVARSSPMYASLDSIHQAETGPANGDKEAGVTHANTGEEEDSKVNSLGVS